MPHCQLSPFGVITVDPDLEVNGQGQNVDSIEFWKAPDSSQTLMFVTAKGNHLVEVWKYPFAGNEQTPLTHSTFNNSQVNGIAIDQQENLLYIAVGEPSSTVSVFSLPALSFQFNFNQNGKNYHSEPNLALLILPNGDKNIYVSADFTVDIHNATTGNFLNDFTPERGLETIAPDTFYERLYIPDENNRTGVYVYNPNGTLHDQNGSNNFGNGEFNADAEGIIVYNCPLSNSKDNGEGFIVVSDQRGNLTDFEFFDRNTWEHLGVLNITGVSNTDGIASFPYPLPDYPLGVFAALNDDKSVAIVGWDKIFNEIFPDSSGSSSGSLPDIFRLMQNYPNPFNYDTIIGYTIVSPSSVSLIIYDVLGNEISTLVNEGQEEGDYEVTFNASDLTSGVYYYRLKAGSLVKSRKMVLLK
jgi:hypothetical protein